MPKSIKTKPPTWMANTPSPQLIEQRFHDSTHLVWKGEVDIARIEGWSGNPRIELLRDEFQDQYAREPTNDEMCEIVLSDEDLKIKELATNIRKNGVRVPIVLTTDKKLLDGNRRYYASVFLRRDPPSAKDRKSFSQIPVFVLAEGATQEVEDAIITEFNFSADMQLEWPYYIRARRVFTDFAEYGLTKEQIQQKYGLPWRYLGKWVKAAELCDRFLKFHNETVGAKQFGYRNFIMFDEMMRNYGSRFDDAEFRESIFQMLMNGYEPENHKNHTFTRSSDVLRLNEIYENRDAWNALVTGRGPHALREALGILEMSTLGGAQDPNPALRRVVKGLEKLVKNKALTSASQDLLQAFQEQAQQVPGGPVDAGAQIEQMVEWLEKMTTKQVSELKPGALSRLERALKLVREMSNSVSKHRARGHA